MARLLAILARVALAVAGFFRREKTRRRVMLCALTLPGSGCASSAVRTSVPPAPMTPGAVVTEGWTHVQGGKSVTYQGAGSICLQKKQENSCSG